MALFVRKYATIFCVKLALEVGYFDIRRREKGRGQREEGRGKREEVRKFFSLRSKNYLR